MNKTILNKNIFTKIVIVILASFNLAYLNTVTSSGDKSITIVDFDVSDYANVLTSAGGGFYIQIAITPTYSIPSGCSPRVAFSDNSYITATQSPGPNPFWGSDFYLMNGSWSVVSSGSAPISNSFANFIYAGIWISSSGWYFPHAKGTMNIFGPGCYGGNFIISGTMFSYIANGTQWLYKSVPINFSNNRF